MLIGPYETKSLIDREMKLYYPLGDQPNHPMETRQLFNIQFSPESNSFFLGKKNKSSLQGGEELRKAVLFLENHLPIALGNVRNV